MADLQIATAARQAARRQDASDARQQLRTLYQMLDGTPSPTNVQLKNAILILIRAIGREL